MLPSVPQKVIVIHAQKESCTPVLGPEKAGGTDMKIGRITRANIGACESKTGLLALRASQVYEGKARDYIQKKDWQKAVSCMDKSIALAPNNCWKYETRKNIYLAVGNTENAIKDLQHFAETLCATPADREELRRLRAQSGVTE